MWHEARKQERLIRGMIVDYRRRAERRKDFYEKIKADPTQFLQIHGRPCKIHLDPAVAIAGEGPAIMMPWQGDTNNMIDRFDVRAHLDYIPEIKYPEIPPDDLLQEERQCNYERYRILAQNAFLGISEDKFLQQLAIEEQFGVTIEEKEAQKEKLHEKKGTGVAIGYNYNDPGAQPSCSNGPEKLEQKDSDDDSDLEIIDVDLSIDVNKMEPSQAHQLNAVGPHYGMAGCDLFSFLTGDADDAEHQKQLMREEKEKAMFSGRKSRRERRAHRDKRLATRVVSPPSYAAPSSLPVRSPSKSPSKSRSPSPNTTGNIEFITSFGGDDEKKPQTPSRPLYADKLKQNLKKVMTYSEIARKSNPRTSKSVRTMGPHRPNSRTRSQSGSISRSRSSSRSRSRSRSYSRSGSGSRSPARRSRSRSRSRNYRRRSRSPANYPKRNESRSIVNESNDKNTQSKPAVPRYYGRKKEDKSSSELSLDSDSSECDEGQKKSTVDSKSNTNQNHIRLSGSSSKGPSHEALTLKEKLKRKMQAQLTRQLRLDKRAEAERREREWRRQARRDEEMRELALRLRRRQRELRHRSRRSSDSNSDGSRSRSSSRDSRTSSRKRDRSRSRSPSPRAKRIPVWEANREPPSFRAKHEASETSSYENRSRFHEGSEEKRYDRNERRFDSGRSSENKQDRYSYRENSRRDYEGRSEGNSNKRDDYRSSHRSELKQNDRKGYGTSKWSSKDSDENVDSSEEYNSKGVKLVDY